VEPSRGPDVRSGPVRREAILALLGAVDACAGRAVLPNALLDVDLMAAEARRFKIDVSFDFSPGQHARFSINDKGEVEAFRRRLRRELPAMGVDARTLDAFLGVAAPGRVQTTLACKWGAVGLDRISLYYEELARDRDAETIRRGVFGLAGLEPPPVPEGAEPVSVCIDLAQGVPLALKSYDVFVDRPGAPTDHVPESLREAVTSLPLHPVNGVRRYMVATRRDARGVDLGSKLLWVPEVHRPSLATWAWSYVDRWRETWGRGADDATTTALEALRRDPAFGDDAFLVPDLIGLNVAGRGTPELLVYVSVR
jgi:hypothetical protein